MIRVGRIFTQALALASICLLTVAGGAAAQPSASSPLVGTWRINMAQTKLNLFGPDKPNPPRDPTFTWTFTPEGDHLRLKAYAKYPQPQPSRSVFVKTDGKPYPCETKTSCWNSAGLETGSRESITYWQISPNMFTRIVKDGDRVVESVALAVSTDGKTLTSNSWNPDRPNYQNFQVFDRLE